MPNGHGGIPRFGAPLLVLSLTALLIWWEKSTGSTLPRILSLIGAGILGWRLAFHLTMWNVTEYDGRYASASQIKAAKLRYLAAKLLLIPLAMVIAYLQVAAK